MKMNEAMANLISWFAPNTPPDPAPVPVAEPPIQQKPKLPEATYSDTAKTAFVNWVATLVPIALGVLLAISNGYFFAGFQPFSLASTNSIIAWGSGFAIEAATLACIFNAALRLRAGDRRGFRANLTVGLVLAFISFTAQYTYLQMSLQDGSLAINDAAIDKIPVLGMFAGVAGFQGHDVLFLVRSSAYHIAEFACTFLIAKKGSTHQKQLDDQRKSFEINMAQQQQDMVLGFMSAINEHFNTMMEDQKQLMSRQFVRITEAASQPLPPPAPAPEPTPMLTLEHPALRKLEALVDGPITAQVDAQEIADALAERAKKAKALWRPQAQPESHNGAAIVEGEVQNK